MVIQVWDRPIKIPEIIGKHQKLSMLIPTFKEQKTYNL